MNGSAVTGLSSFLIQLTIVSHSTSSCRVGRGLTSSCQAPVCTTELGQVGLLSQTFESLNVKPIGLSVDDLKDHQGWIKDIEEVNKCTVSFPIVGFHSSRN